MKKIFLSIMAVLLCITMTACNDTNQTEEPQNQTESIREAIIEIEDRLDEINSLLDENETSITRQQRQKGETRKYKKNGYLPRNTDTFYPRVRNIDSFRNYTPYPGGTMPPFGGQYQYGMPYSPWVVYEFENTTDGVYNDNIQPTNCEECKKEMPT